MEFQRVHGPGTCKFLQTLYSQPLEAKHDAADSGNQRVAKNLGRIDESKLRKEFIF